MLSGVNTKGEKRYEKIRYDIAPSVYNVFLAFLNFFSYLFPKPMTAFSSLFFIISTPGNELEDQ